MEDFAIGQILEDRQESKEIAAQQNNKIVTEEVPQTQCLLPKITNAKNPNQTKSTLPFRTNKLFKLLSQKNSRTQIQKNKSLLQQQTKTIQAIKLLNKIPPLSKTTKKSHLSHVMPRLYQHLEQKNIEQQMTRLRSISLMPEFSSSKVLDDYRIISHVGKGCFSVVSSAVELNSNRKVAIKTYNRIDQMDDIRLKNIQSQVQNLFNLQHINIICLKHAVKDGRKIQLIMQNGGQQSLSGLLRKTTSFHQYTAKKYFKQIAQALAYCHSQNICHRDIKLENILVDDHGNVKLIDFGFSIKCNEKVRLTSFCGTPPYMSPELASRSPYSGQSSDVWALGIALYLMVTGKFPFRSSNQKQLYRLIQQGKYKNENFSPEIKQLLDSMLKVDEKTRITANQITRCNWLNMNNEIAVVG